MQPSAFSSISTEPWITPDEGQLSVDVIETPDAVVIVTAIAGVKPEDLDLYISEDVVTIRGSRADEHAGTRGATFHFRECYWGGFSRTIVLPSHIKPDGADAVMKNGILTITLPKASFETKISVRVEH